MWSQLVSPSSLFLPLQGRNAEEQVKMIEQVREYNSQQERRSQITISVEIEKTREPLYQLFPHGDVVGPPERLSESSLFTFNLRQSAPVCSPAAGGAAAPNVGSLFLIGRCSSARTWLYTSGSSPPPAL